MIALPCAASVLCVLRFRQLGLPGHVERWEAKGGSVKAVLWMLFLCATALMGLAQIWSSHDPGDRAAFHFGFEGAFTRGLEQGWVPANLLLPDVPLSYNYAAHLWMLAAARLSDVPLSRVIAGYAQILLGGAAAATMLGFGRRYLKLPWWISGLAVIGVFWIMGTPSIAAGVFGTFFPDSGNLLLSPFLVVIIFLVLLAFILEGAPSRGIWRCVIIVLLTFLATGARGTCPPVLICALGLRILVAWRSQDGRLWDKCSDLLSAALGFIAGLWLFFTIGTGFSGTGFVHLTWQPFDYLADPGQSLLVVPRRLMEIGIPKMPSGMIAFGLIAIFQAGFLAPLLPFRLAKAVQQPDQAATLLLGCAIAGLAAMFATEAPGYSQMTFLFFPNVALSLLAASGLHGILQRGFRHWQGRSLRVGCLAMTGLLAVLQMSQLPAAGLIWLGRNWTESALMTAHAEMPARTCWRQADADLLALVDKLGPDPVVIMPGAPFACESVWLVVATGVQTLNPYSLFNLPGKASPALGEVLAFRARHMAQALTLAAEGRVSVADMVAIATKPANARSWFVLAAASLSLSEAGGVEQVAHNDRFALWHIQTSVP